MGFHQKPTTINQNLERSDQNQPVSLCWELYLPSQYRLEFQLILRKAISYGTVRGQADEREQRAIATGT